MALLREPYVASFIRAVKLNLGLFLKERTGHGKIADKVNVVVGDHFQRLSLSKPRFGTYW